MHLKQMYLFLSVLVLGDFSLKAMDRALEQKKKNDEVVKFQKQPPHWQHIEHTQSDVGCSFFSIKPITPGHLSYLHISHRKILTATDKNKQSMVTLTQWHLSHAPSPFLFNFKTQLNTCYDIIGETLEALEAKTEKATALAYFNDNIALGTGDGKIHLYKDNGISSQGDLFFISREFKRKFSFINELQTEDSSSVVGLHYIKNNLLSISLKGELRIWQDYKECQKFFTSSFGENQEKFFYCSLSQDKKDISLDVISTYVHDFDNNHYIFLGLSNGKIEVIDYKSRKSIIIKINEKENNINKIDAHEGTVLISSLCNCENRHDVDGKLPDPNDKFHCNGENCFQNNEIYKIQMDEIKSFFLSESNNRDFEPLVKIINLSFQKNMEERKDEEVFYITMGNNVLEDYYFLAPNNFVSLSRVIAEKNVSILSKKKAPEKDVCWCVSIHTLDNTHEPYCIYYQKWKCGKIGVSHNRKTVQIFPTFNDMITFKQKTPEQLTNLRKLTNAFKRFWIWPIDSKIRHLFYGFIVVLFTRLTLKGLYFSLNAVNKASNVLLNVFE